MHTAAVPSVVLCMPDFPEDTRSYLRVWNLRNIFLAHDIRIYVRKCPVCSASENRNFRYIVIEKIDWECSHGKCPLYREFRFIGVRLNETHLYHWIVACAHILLIFRLIREDIELNMQGIKGAIMAWHLRVGVVLRLLILRLKLRRILSLPTWPVKLGVGGPYANYAIFDVGNYPSYVPVNLA